jgi:hypothetical protein
VILYKILIKIRHFPLFFQKFWQYNHKLYITLISGKIMNREEAIQTSRECYRRYFDHKAMGLPENLGVPQSAEFHPEGVYSLDHYERLPYKELENMGYWRVVFSMESSCTVETSDPLGYRERHNFTQPGASSPCVTAIVFENGRLFWQTKNLNLIGRIGPNI